MKVFFSDFFNVDPSELEAYGAFNVSLINDLPVFIDPFLLFNSAKAEYQELHAGIIRYLRFLRDRAQEHPLLSRGLLRAWYLFPEVRQNWLGYSLVGNSGTGLGLKFARALHGSLNTIFTNFGAEQITRSSHLEKLCLIRDGVGRDNISDFTTNLIKGFLCGYTEDFATRHISSELRETVSVPHAEFNYETRTWVTRKFELPYIDGDFVLLTPLDLLTKDDTWISRHGLYGNFRGIAASLPNDQLRAQVNDYFSRQLPREPKHEDFVRAAHASIRMWPELIDYYIRLKEDHGNEAVATSAEHLNQVQQLFVKQVTTLVGLLKEGTDFYQRSGDTYREALDRVLFLKRVIEDNDGYRLFYVNGRPIQRESDLQIIYRFTWFAAQPSVDREVNNGRGPVDYKISRGSKDATLVEFKLARNSKLKQNLANQVEIYKAANDTDKAIKVILAFSQSEMSSALRVLNELGLSGLENVVLIDASPGKPSASNVRSAQG